MTHAIWLCGFRSSTAGEKVRALKAKMHENGHDLTVFDYRGHGNDANSFERYCLSDWIDDARAVYRRDVNGRTVVVGSSMGGYIALLLALEAMKDPAGTPMPGGLVLIAPAVDMTQRLIEHRLSPAAHATLARDGRIEIPAGYGLSPTVITQHLIEDGLRYTLTSEDQRAALARLTLPIHILHGARDPDVPLASSLDLSSRLSAAELTLTIVPDGDHRLSRPEDIALLVGAVGRLQAELSSNARMDLSPSR